MLSRVPPRDHQSTKNCVQCPDCPVAVVYKGKDQYCRRSVGGRGSVSSIVSSSAGSITGHVDTSGESEAQHIHRAYDELPILRAQYVARGVRVLFGSRWRLNRFQQRTIVLRTGPKPTLAVYVEDNTEASFDLSASEARPEATYELALSTNCEFTTSGGPKHDKRGKASAATGIELSSAESPAFRLRIRFATTADANIWCSIVREALEHALWSRDVQAVKQERKRSRRRNIRVVQHVISSQRFVVKVLAVNCDERDCHELQILRSLYSSRAARDVRLVAGYRIVETTEEILLIMPHYPGSTLLQLLRQRRRQNDGKLSEEEGWRLLARMTELLQAVHRSGIIHCDLNLENVLVSHDLSQVWLIDFEGAYNLLDAHHYQQMTGTPGFVAPERVKDALLPPTPKTDVFGLGIALFQALTGQHPYDGAAREKRPLQLLDSLSLDWTQAEKIMTEHSISPELRDKVAEMLKADPQARVSLDSVAAVECPN
ncbi:serine/threonine protein kinase [Phytophthora nicotianae]|uniref:Serine/threonine protein kinase n=1 Tax=Phytophthora nicotianae TaxID=4792 RepID=W2K5A7_PHYNI|nr:serine/threonine protein kinase [Phytophthora nicotianae]